MSHIQRAMAKTKRQQPERELHKAVAELMSYTGPKCWWSTIAHGGLMIPAHVGKRLKEMGLKPGVPDIHFLHAGRAFYMELKAPGNYPTPAQRDCHDAIRLAGGTVGVIRSVEEAETFLRTEGVL